MPAATQHERHVAQPRSRRDDRARASRWRRPRGRATSICLWGDLGAGKTHLAKAFGAGLGVTDTITSPSFVLMAEYAGRLPLFHIDLYRLADASDALAGGLIDDRQAAGVTLVEWPERLGPALPAERLDVVIDGTGDEPRTITLRARRRRACGATSRSCRDAAGRAGRDPGHRQRHDAGSSSRSGRSTATLIDAADWPAGYRHGETLLPAIDALLDAARDRARRGSRRSSSAPGPARSPGCASGSRRPRASPTRSAGRSSASRPARRCWPDAPATARRPAAAGRAVATGSSSGAGRRRGSLPAGAEPELAPDATLVAVDLAGRAPGDALARGEAARAGLGAALLAPRRGPAGRGRRRRPGPARARVRDAAARRPHRDAGRSSWSRDRR